MIYEFMQISNRGFTRGRYDHRAGAYQWCRYKYLTARLNAVC